MTNGKTTKRALLSSVLALFLCFTMLLGTTFAWFTDSVTSDVNIIQTGTLEIGMYWAEGDEDPASVTWKDASQGAIFNNTKWEPGYVEAKHIKIANEGTLALKYALAIVPVGEVSELAEVIDVYLLEGARDVDRTTQFDESEHLGTLADVINKGIMSGSLEADDKTTEAVEGVYTATLVLKLSEEAGNEYQGLKIGDSFTVQLLATQLSSESDSIDNKYDEDAIFYDKLVTTDAELKAAIENPNVKTIAISGNLTYDWGDVTDGANALKGITLVGYNGTADSITFKGLGAANDIPNVNLKNITVFDSTISATENSWEYTYLEFNSLTANNVVFKSGILLKGYSKLTDCSVNSNAKEYGVWILDGNATLKNCTFTGARGVKIHEQYATNGRDNNVETVVIDGCVFNSLTEKPGVAIDSLNTQITIKNSTFINCQAGDQGLYIYETDNTVPTLENNTVVKPVDTADGLNDAIANGNSVILTDDITMDAGNFTVAAGTKAVIDLNGNDLTVTGTDGATPAFLMVQGDLTITGEGNVAVRQINASEGSNLTIGEGVKISTSNAFAINNSGTTEINGATINHTGTDHAIQNQGGTLTINDATVTSTSASNINTINSTGGTVTINGGTFTHNGSMGSVICDPYGNSEIIINGGTFVQNGSDSLVNMDMFGKLTINGGTFDAASQFCGYETAITINAGVFKNNAKVVDYGYGNFNSMIPATSTATTNADGSITVMVNE